MDRRRPRPRPTSAAHVVLVGLLGFGLLGLATLVDGGSGSKEAGAVVEASAGTTTATAAPGSSPEATTEGPTTSGRPPADDGSPTTTAAAEVGVLPKTPGVPRVYTAGDSTAGGLG